MAQGLNLTGGDQLQHARTFFQDVVAGDYNSLLPCADCLDVVFDPCCPPALVTRRNTCSFAVYVKQKDTSSKPTALALNVIGCPPKSQWRMALTDPRLGSSTARELATSSGDSLHLGDFKPGRDSDWLLWVTNE